jgi:hypothetical protein
MPRNGSPLERTEDFCRELTAWYGEGKDRELRAATKLLLVALTTIRAHGGPGWEGIVHDYLNILVNDPERFEQMLDSQRGETKRQSGSGFPG